MKVDITLDSENDGDETIRIYMSSMDLFLFVSDVFNELRSDIKYKEEKDWRNIEQLREYMQEQLEERGISSLF